MAQENRPRLPRLQRQHGPDGLPQGKIARPIGMPPDTLSTHPVIRPLRESRRVFCGVELPAFPALRACLILPVGVAPLLGRRPLQPQVAA